MRRLFLPGISLLAVSACAPQPAPPPAVAGQPITPVSYASGSPANTTRAFDGTFTGLAVQGYVTPQGGLMMNSGVGQTFQGQIDSRNVLSGQVLGRSAYNLSWQKSA